MEIFGSKITHYTITGSAKQGLHTGVVHCNKKHYVVIVEINGGVKLCKPQIYLSQKIHFKRYKTNQYA